MLPIAIICASCMALRVFEIAPNISFCLSTSRSSLSISSFSSNASAPAGALLAEEDDDELFDPEPDPPVEAAGALELACDPGRSPTAPAKPSTAVATAARAGPPTCLATASAAPTSVLPRPPSASPSCASSPLLEEPLAEDDL